MFKLRLHSGKHIQADPAWTPKKDLAGKVIPDQTPSSRTFNAGDIVENEADLAARWPEKFEYADRVQGGPLAETSIRPGESLKDFAARMAALASTPTDVAKSIPTSPPASQSGDAKFPTLSGRPTAKNKDEYAAQLNSLTVKELQALAAEEEVDVKGSADKKEIVKALLTNR